MTKITLDLGTLQHDAHELVAELRNASHNHGHSSHNEFHWLAEQIEAQLPKPIPAEPGGNAIVLDRDGDVWHMRKPHAWRTNVGTPDFDWLLLNERYGPIAIYRPAPSPERVEELVQKHAGQRYDLQWERPPYEAALREFAAALLGAS